MLCVGAILCIPFFLFDALVRLQYKKHQEIWELDGKPSCYFWIVEGFSNWRFEGFAFKRQWAAQKCFMNWIRKTPDWMKTEPKALKLLFWLRFSYYAFIVVWIIGIIFVIQDIHNKPHFK